MVDGNVRRVAQGRALTPWRVTRGSYWPSVVGVGRDRDGVGQIVGRRPLDNELVAHLANAEAGLLGELAALLLPDAIKERCIALGKALLLRMAFPQPPTLRLLGELSV
jgi:hypothetical protein